MFLGDIISILSQRLLVFLKSLLKTFSILTFGLTIEGVARIKSILDFFLILFVFGSSAYNYLISRNMVIVLGKPGKKYIFWYLSSLIFQSE